MPKFEAAIFDIDGTLSPVISWMALTRDLGASVEKHLDIYRAMDADGLPYEEAKQRLLRLWQRTGNANRKFIENLYETWPLRDGAEELIRYLQSKECIVCLITGSIEQYAKIMAKRLGVEHWYGNREMVWDREGNLIDFHYDHGQAKRKLAQFIEFCTEQKISPENCLVVGDDENDRELFIRSGHGVAVKSKTSHQLDDVAWQKVDDLLDIKKFA
jgi:HAD superfamily phosphoserine phosphatase-like hydrolase